MIAVELESVVVDDPWSHAGGHHGRPYPLQCAVGGERWERLQYLPQLALVLLTHRNGNRFLVPIEHVWHMTAAGVGLDLLGELARVVA